MNTLTIEQKQKYICLQSALAESDEGIKGIYAMLWHGTMPFKEMSESEIEISFTQLEVKSEQDVLNLLKEYNLL